MRTRSLLPLLALVASGVDADPRVVKLGLTKLPDVRPPPLRRRQTYVENLANNLTGAVYYIDIEVGTPPQPQYLVLDTGSSDLWLPASNADLCLNQLAGGCVTTYDKTRSSTYNLIQQNGFQISYLSGETATGDYISDNVNVGGALLRSLQMGLGTRIALNTGILGIGFSNNVAALTVYPNIMDVMVAQGLIASQAYSLYLNDFESKTGNILFGGLDTQKFIGKLETVPILPDTRTGNLSAFAVVLSSVAVTPTGQAPLNVTVGRVPVILDSGTTLSYLPNSIVQPIYAAFNVVDDSAQTGLSFVDCSYRRSNPGLTIDFGFGPDPTTGSRPFIRVPVDELVLDNLGVFIQAGLLRLPPNLGFTDVCSFGLSHSEQFSSTASQQIGLLGDTFLRSAYVVYDLTHGQVGMAQANLNSTQTNIVEIGTAGIPPALTGVASQVPSSPSPTSSGNGDVSTVTVTASPNAAASYSSPLVLGASGLVAVAATALGLLAGAMSLWL